MTRRAMSPPKAPLLLPLLLILPFLPYSQSSCYDSGCTALASYYAAAGENVSYIGYLFNIIALADLKSLIPSYNPNITSIDYIPANSPINVPFNCSCLDSSSSSFLAHDFHYTIGGGDTYNYVANDLYKNLTTASWLATRNSHPKNNIPVGADINVTINCSCGDPDVSMDYGLFVTYPLRPGQTWKSVAAEFGFASVDLLRRYNERIDIEAGTGIVFIPVKDSNGSYRPLSASKQGISAGSIIGISVAAGVVLLIFAVSFIIYKGRKRKDNTLLNPSADESGPRQEVAINSLRGGTPPVHAITVDKSVEFSYEELAMATGNFSLANKIGEGGFAAVYYAELRGERTAVKRMAMQSTKQFLAELNVLARVHHLNLVHLIGYCIKDSLFLVYEYMENGNLSQHLRNSAQRPLSWANRVQIALDSARGLEYIHEHTVPVYIHRDIKSANILLDKSLHAKVADFGLTKLTTVQGASKDSSTPTRLVGTFGYMPPEYAQYGDVSPKIDVYAFGVVLYELISAKEAVLTTGTGAVETRGLASMFGGVFTHTNPREELSKLIDPRLGDDYPMDAVYKMAELARACTQEDPQLRPNMRNIVVALMMLSSSTEEWDVGQFNNNHAFSNLMSGR